MNTEFGPTVAGRFYPAYPNTLHEMVQGYLDDARSSVPQKGGRTIAIIAPHAGYVYSGKVAGFAYASVASSEVKTVFVMGPSHFDSDSHACTLDADVYRTPLGNIPIAREVVAKLIRLAPDLFRVNPGIFEPEHSVDVHMPFLKLAMPAARVVPIILPFVTQSKLDAIANLLFDLTQKDEKTLIVASSDLSHFFAYDQAKKIDLRILDEIKHFDTQTLLGKHDERRGPCGVAPIITTLQVLNRYTGGSEIDVLSYLNSGDTQAGRDRVVGYPAVALRIH